MSADSGRGGRDGFQNDSHGENYSTKIAGDNFLHIHKVTMLAHAGLDSSDDVPPSRLLRVVQTLGTVFTQTDRTVQRASAWLHVITSGQRPEMQRADVLAILGGWHPFRSSHIALSLFEKASCPGHGVKRADVSMSYCVCGLPSRIHETDVGCSKKQSFYEVNSACSKERKRPICVLRV